jgi:hypothetical protein
LGSISVYTVDSALIRCEKQLASFHDYLFSARKEVIDDLHSVELEKKLRLPDPTKTMETVWKMLRRTKQQVDLTSHEAAAISGSSGTVLSEKKRARIAADYSKGRGTVYALRTTIR